MQMAAMTQRGFERGNRVSRADREEVLRAVALNGLALLYASPELRGDREIVLAAVVQNGRVLAYASEELCGDREIVLAAVASNRYALQWASPEVTLYPPSHPAPFASQLDFVSCL